MTVTPTQTWQAESYDRDARFVSDLGAAVLGWLAPQPGERILDLGCGDGALTTEIAAAGASVLGADMSDDLLAAAAARGLDVVKADGQALGFDQEFDAVFSNAALHWMTRAEDVADGVARALKPGGRFVAECGGHGNVAAIVTAMRAAGYFRGADWEIAQPGYFASPEAYRAILEKAGFSVLRIALIPRPTPLPTGMRAWLELFRAPFFDQFADDERDAVMDDVLTLLRPSLCDEAGNWTADYVRLRFEARLS